MTRKPLQRSQDNTPTTGEKIESELRRLETANIADLRTRYLLLFQIDPRKSFGSDLLRRSIAQRIQEKAFGSLSKPTQQALTQLDKTVRAQPNGNVEMVRRIKPGSVLVREWKGISHRVMVVVDGFAYNGKTYSNLSEIASSITGTRWNGPRFFGLRRAMDKPGKSGRVAAK